MKALVQRVSCGRVTVGDREVSRIGPGLCVLLGISRYDTAKEAEWMARKLLNLRLFDSPATEKAWEKSVLDLDLEILCVSQFTLCHVLKGNKPDFHNAMTAELSQPMYDDFLKLLASLYKPEKVKGGEFGAVMQVHIQNDGPVTLHIETPNIPPAKERKPQGSTGKKAEGGGKKKGKQPTSSEQQDREPSVATATAGLTLEEDDTASPPN